MSDDQEISLVRNSIAAQEFGSDYTDTYDMRGVSLAWSLARTGWRPSLEAAYERHEPLFVHTRPATGAFEPTIPAVGLREASATLGLDRPTALFLAGFELGAHFALTGIRVIRPTAIEARLLRPSLVIDLEKPFGSSRV